MINTLLLFFVQVTLRIIYFPSKLKNMVDIESPQATTAVVATQLYEIKYMLTLVILMMFRVCVIILHAETSSGLTSAAIFSRLPLRLQRPVGTWQHFTREGST